MFKQKTHADSSRFF